MSRKRARESKEETCPSRLSQQDVILIWYRGSWQLCIVCEFDHEEEMYSLYFPELNYYVQKQPWKNSNGSPWRFRKAMTVANSESLYGEGTKAYMQDITCNKVYVIKDCGNAGPHVFVTYILGTVCEKERQSVIKNTLRQLLE